MTTATGVRLRSCITAIVEDERSSWKQGKKPLIVSPVTGTRDRIDLFLANIAVFEVSGDELIDAIRMAQGGCHD